MRLLPFRRNALKEATGTRIGVLQLRGNVDEKSALDLVSRVLALSNSGADWPFLLVPISSGGGSLASAQVIVECFELLRSELGIELRAVVAEQALSAGYYVAAACDHVTAAPAALVGGVGSTIRALRIDGALNGLGLAYSSISSAPYKDILLPLRTSDHGDDVLKLLVEDHHSQFMEFVARRRGLDASVSAIISDGRPFTGSEALKLGLIDAVGGMIASIETGAIEHQVESVILDQLN